MKHFDPKFWNKHYVVNDRPAWDAGSITTPLKAYFDQLRYKDIRILVPGAGHAYEVEYLYNNGFKNTFLLDFAEKPVETFRLRNPGFPQEQILIQDFFDVVDQFDLIVEQTFFTSFHPSQRERLVRQYYKLLKTGGKLVGLFFNHIFDQPYPPFGAYPDEYKLLFKDGFKFHTFQTAYNSIKPRRNRELFVILEKKYPDINAGVCKR